MQKLTDAEKQIMDILWEKGKAFMKDLIEAAPEPKPAGTTVATLLKRMHNKKMIGYKTYGNSREYFPMVEKGAYFAEEVHGLIGRFFNNSVSQFASFFAADARVSGKELAEIQKIIENELKNRE